MNKHKESAPVYQKCKNVSCNYIIRRAPYEVEKGLHIYCTAECSYTQQGNVRRKYTDKDIKFITENINKITLADMALKYKSTPESFRKAICKMRGNGFEIPLANKGLRSSKETKEAFKLKKKQDRKPKKTKVAVAKPRGGKFSDKPRKLVNLTPSKKKPTVFKTRVVDKTKLKSVRINSKTEIHVLKSIPDDVAIKSYYDKVNKNKSCKTQK